MPSVTKSQEPSQFGLNIQAFREFVTRLENRKFTQKHLAELFFVSERTVTRWEAGFEASETHRRLAADGINRYFGKWGIAVGHLDMLRPEFIEWLKGVLTEASAQPARKVRPKTENWPYSQRSLETLLKENPEMCLMLGIDENGAQFLRSKLNIYRSDLTEQDWLAIFQLHLRGELDAEEWKFKDAEVVTARLHFKSPRPLTAKELQVAERAAREAVRAYQLQEQAKRKKEPE